MKLHQERFASGQLSSRLLGTVSTDLYREGCLALENSVLGKHGSAKKRPGTKYVGGTRENNPARLIPFRIVGTGDYIVELTDSWIRVWDATTGTVLEHGSGNTGIPSPYPVDDIFDVQWSQHESSIYLVHGSHAPRKLTYGATAWTLAEWPLSPGPQITSTTTTATAQEPILTYTEAGDANSPNRIKTENEDTFVPTDAPGYWRLGNNWIYVNTYTNPRQLGATGWTTEMFPTNDTSYPEWMGGFQAQGPSGLNITFETVPSNPNDLMTCYLAGGEFSGKTGYVLDVSWNHPGTAGAGDLVGQIIHVYDSGTRANVQVFTRRAISGLTPPGFVGVNSQFYLPAERPLSNDWLQPSDISGEIWLYRGNVEWGAGDVGKTIFLNGGSVTINTIDGTDAKRAQCTTQQNLDYKWSTVIWGTSFATSTGFPSVIAQHAGRMWMGGVDEYPRHFFASKIDDYNDWTVSTNDNFGMSHELSSDEAMRITWMKSAADLGQGGTAALMIGTSIGEYVIKGGPITPTNIGADRFFSSGSSKQQVAHAENGVLMYNRSGSSLRFLSVLDNRTSLPDFADRADDLFSSTAIKDVAYVREPEKVIFAAREGADLCAMTFAPENGVAGWSPWTGLEAVSLASISLDTGDELFMCVKRTVRGLVSYYIERLVWGQYLDSFVDSNSGLEHLETETVGVVINGAYQEERTVSSGAIQLTGHSSYRVGLNYAFKLQPILPEYTDEKGTTPGRRREISNVNVQLRATASYGTINGDSFTAREVEVLGPNRWYRVVGLRINALQPVITIQCDEAVDFEVLLVSADTKQGVL